MANHPLQACALHTVQFIPLFAEAIILGGTFIRVRHRLALQYCNETEM